MDVQPTLYDSLIEPLRVLDTSTLLHRFLERPQYHVDATYDRMTALALLDSAETCPDALLVFLKDHVGMTSDISEVTENLSAANLRKLIRAAVSLWKQKGTTSGVMATGLYLTGRHPLYHDWFARRFTLGESQIGQRQNGMESTFTGSFDGPPGEYSSVIYLMDDGYLDSYLVLSLFGLMRPALERFEIMLLDFLDIFTGTKDSWTSLAAVQAVVADDKMSLPPGALEKPEVSVVPLEGRHDYIVAHRIYLGGAGDVHRVYWYYTSEGYLQLDISESAVPLVLTQYWQGTPTVLYSGPTHPYLSLVAEHWYDLRIETSTRNTGPYVEVYIDELLQCAVQAGGGSTQLLYGDVLLEAPNTNTASNCIDTMKIWRMPARWAVLGMGGQWVSDGFHPGGSGEQVIVPPPPPPPAFVPYILGAGDRADS